MRTMYALVAALVMAAPTLAEEARVVRVTGAGQATATPVCAHVVAGVVTSHDKATTSLKNNSEAMSKVFRSLKDSGIASEDITTVHFAIEPRYQHIDNQKPPKFLGYFTVNTVSVKVRNVKDLGTLLDTLVNAGANSIGGIAFETDTAKATEVALASAMRNARSKAEVLAKAGGFQVGDVSSVSESVHYQPRMYQLSAMADQAPGGAPISAGTRTVTVTVDVSFSIKSNTVTGSRPGK